jgi:hypothetical protein
MGNSTRSKRLRAPRRRACAIELPSEFMATSDPTTHRRVFTNFQPPRRRAQKNYVAIVSLRHGAGGVAKFRQHKCRSCAGSKVPVSCMHAESLLEVLAKQMCMRACMKSLWAASNRLRLRCSGPRPIACSLNSPVTQLGHTSSDGGVGTSRVVSRRRPWLLPCGSGSLVTPNTAPLGLVPSRRPVGSGRRQGHEERLR